MPHVDVAAAFRFIDLPNYARPVPFRFILLPGQVRVGYDPGDFMWGRVCDRKIDKSIPKGNPEPVSRRICFARKVFSPPTRYVRNGR